MDFIRTYSEGIIDRLTEEGATLDDAALVTDPNGEYAIYRLDISSTGVDDYLKFTSDFAADHYPNEHGTPSATAVQILLKDAMDRSYKNVSLNIAAVFYTDDQGRDVVLFRILGGTVYFENGETFKSPRLADIVNLVTALDQPERVVAEAGEE